MKKLSIAILAFGAALFATSCQENTNKDKAPATDTTAKAVAAAPIALVPTGPSPDFPDASLTIKSVKAEKVGADSAKVTFDFNVKNYELKSQTSDTDAKVCNNSAQGQHIHFIMDEKPYKALYEPTNQITLANNTEHYLMAFLSRSYHESVKNKGAALVYHFKIDEKGNLKKLEDPKTPMVFYSRPKGDYVGKDIQNVLLDYYIWNCDLTPEGYKIKAKIANGAHDTTVTISNWEPHFIQNLGTGKANVTLTLIDKDGKQVDGPNTTATREFGLMEKEGAK